MQKLARQASKRASEGHKGTFSDRAARLRVARSVNVCKVRSWTAKYLDERAGVRRLNRRGGRKKLDWPTFQRLLSEFKLPPPRIVHGWDKMGNKS